MSAKIFYFPHPFTIERREETIEANVSLASLVKQARSDIPRGLMVRTFVNGNLITADKRAVTIIKDDDEIIVRIVPANGSSTTTDREKVAANKRFAGAAIEVLSILTAVVAGFFTGGATWVAIPYIIGVGMTVGTGFLIGAGLTESGVIGGPYADEKKVTTHPSIHGASNTTNPNGKVPLVLGKNLLTPYYLCPPYTEISGTDGRDQYLHMAFLLGYGPLSVSNIQFGDMLIASNSANITNGTIACDGVLPGCEAEIRQDTISGTGLTNYPKAIIEQTFQSSLARYHKLESDKELAGITITVDAIARTFTRSAGDWTLTGANVSDVRVGDYITFSGFTNAANNAQCLVTAVSALVIYCNQASTLVNETKAGTSAIVVPANIQTTAKKTTSISVTITFPKLLKYDSNGKDKLTANVIVYPYYRLKVAPGLTPNAWTLLGTFDGGLNSITRAKAETMRFEAVSGTLTEGQYEVFIMRATEDATDSAIQDQVYWTSLQSRTTLEIMPANIRKKVCLLGIKVKASEAVQNCITKLNCIVAADYSYIISIDPSHSWSTIIASDPRNSALAFIHALMGPANPRPRAAMQLDWTSIYAFAQWCDTLKGLSPNQYRIETNGIVTNASKLSELINKILAQARASLTLSEGTYGVVYDYSQTVPKQHIGPHNSWGFRGTKTFGEIIHGYRIKFVNKDIQYVTDERIILDDGYKYDTEQDGILRDCWGVDKSADPTIIEATKFETMEAALDTTPAQVFGWGRYMLAVRRLRPELFTVSMDAENLAVKRGELVKISHPAPRWGLADGRITAVTLDGSSNIIAFSTNNTLAMELGKSYAVRFRTAAGTSIYREVTTIVGDTHSLTLSTNIPAGSDIPAIGDMFFFGIATLETVDCIVAGIDLNADLSAKLTLFETAPAVHVADAGAIPDFNSKVSFGPKAFAPSTSLGIYPQSPDVISYPSQKALTTLSDAVDFTGQYGVYSGRRYVGTMPATWTLNDVDGVITMTSATTPSGTYEGQVGLWNAQFYTWSFSGNQWVLVDAVLPTDTPSVYLSFDEVPDIPDDPAGVIYRLPAPLLNITGYPFINGAVTGNATGQTIVVVIRANKTIIDGGYPQLILYNVDWSWTCAIPMDSMELKNYVQYVTLPSSGAVGWAVYYMGASGSSNLYDLYIGTGAYLTPVVDNSGNGNHGTNTGAVPIKGVSGKGLIFNGSTNYIDCPGFSGPPANALTVSGWILFSTSQYGKSIISKHSDASGGFSIGIDDTAANKIKFHLNSYTYRVNSTMTLNDGFWHHVAGTWDGTTLKLYVDGILNASNQLANALSNPSVNLSIGRWPGGLSQYFDGSIDEPTIFFRTLSPSEIRGLYLAKSLPKLYSLADYRIAEAADDGKITQAEKVQTTMPRWWDIYAATDVTSAMPSAPSVVGEYKTLRDAANAVSIWTPTGSGTAAKAYYDAAEALRAYLFTTPGVLLTSSWSSTITITKATWLGLLNTYKTTAHALSAAISAVVAAADATTKANSAKSYADGLALALQTQVDRAIIYYTQAGNPADAWTTIALKNEHIGDYWRTAAGAVWTQWSGAAWTTISDPVAQAAASAAQGTANTKTTLWATLALAQASGVAGDMFLTDSILYRATVAAASITLANSTRLTPQRYADVANATALSALSGMILGDTVYQTDTLQWYVYTTSWVVDGPALMTVVTTYGVITMTSATTPSGTYEGQVGLWNAQFYTWSVSGNQWVNADATLPTDTPALYLSFDEVPDIPDDPAGVIYRLPAPLLNITGYPFITGAVTGNATGQTIVVVIRANKTIIDGGYPQLILYNTDWSWTCAIPMDSMELKNYVQYVTLPSSGAVGWAVYYMGASGSSNLYDLYIGTGAYLTPSVDNSGNSHHGIVNKTTPIVGVSGKGIRCEAFGGIVSMPAGLDFTGVYVVSFWYKKYPTSTTYRTLIASYNADIHPLIIFPDATCFSIWDGARKDFTGSVVPADSNWHHIVVKYFPTVAYLYIDTIYIASCSHALNLATNKIGQFGNWYGGNYPGGSFDEIVMFQRDIDVSEIRGLYLARSLPKLYTMADYKLAEAADDGKITQAEKVSWVMPKWWDIYAATDVTSAMPSAPSVVGEYKTLCDAANAVSIWTPTGAGTAAKAYYDAAEALRAYLFTTPGVLLTSSWAATITITKATWLGLWNTYLTTKGALVSATNAAVAAADATTKANSAKSYADGLALALQTQVDRAIIYYTQAGNPADAWTTIALKNEHIGDYWRTAAGAVWTQWSGAAWTTISDPVAQAAASAAQGTANTKTTLWATLALAQASGVAGDMFLTDSILYRATVAAASITLANSTRLTPQRYADVANATALSALSGMILGDTVYQTDTLQWYVYTTSWVVDGPALMTVVTTYAPYYLGRYNAAHPYNPPLGAWWTVFDTDDSPIARGVYYNNAGTPTRITTSSSADLQGKMVAALADVAWAEANGYGIAANYGGFDVFFTSMSAVTAFIKQLFTSSISISVTAGTNIVKKIATESASLTASPLSYIFAYYIFAQVNPYFSFSNYKLQLMASGSVRVSFSLKCFSDDALVYGRIYKRAINTTTWVAVGTERINSGVGYWIFSEDLSVTAGDTFTLFVKSSDPNKHVLVKDFTLAIAEPPGILAGIGLGDLG